LQNDILYIRRMKNYTSAHGTASCGESSLKNRRACRDQQVNGISMQGTTLTEVPISLLKTEAYSSER